MASLEKNNTDVSTYGDEKDCICEDEINLMDYFVVIWKRKWCIFFASVLPALVVGLFLYLSPRDYTVSYTYSMRLDERAFRILENKFYSSENLERLVKDLRSNKLSEYAEKIENARTSDDLRSLISFSVSPAFFETITASEAKNLEELEKIQQAKAALLVMQITAKSEADIDKIALVCRGNFEKILPLYAEKEELNNKIIGFKAQMAGIEESRYRLGLELARKKDTLDQLKKTGSLNQDKLQGEITLQFNNVSASSAYLPLAYQVQAAETKIINLQEQICANKEDYAYYFDLLGLNEKLFGCVKGLIASGDSVEKFHGFLNATLGEYDQVQVQDYLKAYIKKIENKIASVEPLVEKPKVYALSKGTVKKSGLVFVIAMMIAVFGAFLSEGFKNYRSLA